MAMTTEAKVRPMREYYVTCMPGLEEPVAAELRLLGAEIVRTGGFGVQCRGDEGLRYRANLWLRAAIRVLEPILHAEVVSPESLYDAVRSVDWRRHMTVEQTLSVDCRLRDSQLRHSGYAALKVKDAVVDQFREGCGRRPDVDPKAADLPLHLHLAADRAVLSRDTSGTTLHKRGYRGAMVKAPLNEALAAGILMLTGWDRASSLADPMCGSGTLPIEAAMMAADIAPGLRRPRFPFEGWPDFDAKAWRALREEASARALRELPFPIYASDHHAGALDLARKTARLAGVESLIRFSVADIADFAPDPPPRTIVVNPPYGERIEADADLHALYWKMGSALRRFPGATAWVLCASKALAVRMGFRATSEIKLLNGAIECRLLRYDIWPGSRKAEAKPE